MQITLDPLHLQIRICNLFCLFCSFYDIANTLQNIHVDYVEGSFDFICTE